MSSSISENGNPICDVCGEEMEDYSADFWYCPECGNKAFITYGDKTRTIHQESEYEDDIIDMDDRPIECQACDSDCYPACKDGCPAMDD